MNKLDFGGEMPRRLTTPHGAPTSVLKRRFPVFSTSFEVTNFTNLPLKTMWSDVKPANTYEPFSVRRPELSFDKVVRLFDDIRDFGTRFVILHGGEIFLREDALEVMAEARSRFVTQITTNATVMNEEICKSLKRLNVPVIVYSPAFSRKTYEGLSQVKGSYARLVKGIKEMVDAKIQLSFLVPLTRPLIPVLEESVRAIGALGGTIIKFTMFPGSGYGQRYADELAPSRLESMEAVLKIESLRERYGRRIQIYHQFVAPYLGNNCGSGYAVDPYGNVMPCPYLRIHFGNLFKDDISSIWERIIVEHSMTVAHDGPRPIECAGCTIVSPLTGTLCNGGCRCVAHNIYGKMSGPDWGCSYLALRQTSGA